MNAIDTNKPAVQTYISALREARHFEPRPAAVILTILTGLLQVHEITALSTHVDDEGLTVSGRHAGMARSVPPAQALTATLQRSGTLSKILDVSPTSVRDGLAAHLLDHEGLVGTVNVEDIWGIAVNGLLAAAATPEVRRAVRAYIGHSTASNDELQGVADLVDACCRRAGYAVA